MCVCLYAPGAVFILHLSDHGWLSQQRNHMYANKQTSIHANLPTHTCWTLLLDSGFSQIKEIIMHGFCYRLKTVTAFPDLKRAVLPPRVPTAASDCVLCRRCISAGARSSLSLTLCVLVLSSLDCVSVFLLALAHCITSCLLTPCWPLLSYLKALTL